jgi:hypothetical protein
VKKADLSDISEEKSEVKRNEKTTLPSEKTHFSLGDGTFLQ